MSARKHECENASNNPMRKSASIPYKQHQIPTPSQLCKKHTIGERNPKENLSVSRVWNHKPVALLARNAYADA
jgi:hypothetical protein